MFSRHDYNAGETQLLRSQTVELETELPTVAANGLIGHFKSDHAALVERLRRIEDLAMHGQFADIPQLLEAFRDRLQAHLDEESEKFYAPLHARNDQDSAASQIVTREETRMTGIARLVLIFNRRYIETGVAQHNRDAFACDLDVIESLLVDRIRTEETTLYPLYCPG